MLARLLLWTATAFFTAATALPDSFTSKSFQSRDVPSFSDLVRNASALFGWEIAAMAKDRQQLNVFCSGFDYYGGHWTAVGLDANFIKAPICESATRLTAPSAEDIRIQIYSYSTDIFITQLVNALEVNSPDQHPAPLVYLCQSALSYRRLSQFSLDANRVVAAVCNIAGVDIHPAHFGNESLNQTAVNDFVRAVSALFANELATAAETADDLSKLCFAAPEYLEQMASIGLDGAVTWQYLCYIWMPLSAGEAVAKIVDASTQAFIHEIMHVDRDVPGWNKWLCENLSGHGMRRVGLDGDLVLRHVC